MKITPQNVSKAANASFGMFDPFRSARRMFMRQMAGRFYGRQKSARSEDEKASPLNMLYSAVGTLVPNLVYNDPRTKIRTQVLMYRDYGDLLELATNHTIQRIGLRSALRKAIFDSIFMAGFIKTGLAAGDQFISLEGVDVPVGQPFAERVDPDDIILDPWARDWEEQSFIGNRFRMPLDMLQDSGLYDPDVLKKFSKTMDETKRVAQMSGEVPEEYAEITRYVDLVELYFPREKIIVTMPYQRDAKVDEFLRVADYNGPDTGPYHMLGYTPVSDNILPVAPAGIWYDLHIMGNKIARKLARQAERLKQVLAYEGEAQEDVEEIADADDGETVRVQDINRIKEVKFGGAAPESYEWMEWVKRQFSEQSGNIEMLSGTGSNVPTATQAEMLQANTSVRLGDMQGLVYHFTADVVRDLSFFLHTDPLIELPLIQRKPVMNPMTGMMESAEQQVYYTPEQRRGDFLDFTFKIQPYSMARPDPNMAVRRKIEFMTNVIPAVTQAAMMLGPGFKPGPALRDIATEVQIETADEWLDDVVIQDYIAKRTMQAMMMGDPGKANEHVKAPPMPGMGMGFNPMQPVPGAMGPTGGISPATEQASAQQETAGELQGTFEPSARALAMQR